MVRQSQPLVDQGDRKGQRRGVKDLEFWSHVCHCVVLQPWESPSFLLGLSSSIKRVQLALTVCDL